MVDLGEHLYMNEMEVFPRDISSVVTIVDIALFYRHTAMDIMHRYIEEFGDD
jgi:hypothetical protein